MMSANLGALTYSPLRARGKQLLQQAAPAPSQPVGACVISANNSWSSFASLPCGSLRSSTNCRGSRHSQQAKLCFSASMEIARAGLGKTWAARQDGSEGVFVHCITTASPLVLYSTADT